MWSTICWRDFVVVIYFMPAGEKVASLKTLRARRGFVRARVKAS